MTSLPITPTDEWAGWVDFNSFLDNTRMKFPWMGLLLALAIIAVVWTCIVKG